MTVQDKILHLQWHQLGHDERYHRDILLLNVADRMKHMALHIAKYAGQVTEAHLAKDSAKLAKTIIDTFIICLATANTINLNLGRETVATLTSGSQTLHALGLDFAREIRRPDGDGLWFALQMSRIAGRLAKACESLDHVEAFPFREQMRASVLDLFKAVLAEAAAIGIDLERLSKERLRQVERGHMFDGFYRSDPEP